MTIGPGRIDAYAILSAVNAAQGNWTDMEALLARAEKAVPDDLTPYYRAAEAILLSGREFPRAERLLRKYLATTPEGNAPTFSEAHWQLGLVMEKEARRAEAIAEWSESVRLDSDSPAKRELRRLKSQN
jgi:tetratricopeptide (TPR) repeat protein